MADSGTVALDEGEYIAWIDLKLGSDDLSTVDDIITALEVRGRRGVPPLARGRPPDEPPFDEARNPDFVWSRRFDRFRDGHMFTMTG